MPGRTQLTLRLLAALLLLVIAGVHFQQYVQFMSHVPWVGVLFLLNAGGGAAIAVALLGPDRDVRALAALGGIGLALGSLVSLVIALTSSFAGYHEPSLRIAILIAIISEALAVPALAALVVRALRDSRVDAKR
jgi:hypothetical protein